MRSWKWPPPKGGLVKDEDPTINQGPTRIFCRELSFGAWFAAPGHSFAYKFMVVIKGASAVLLAREERLNLA